MSELEPVSKEICEERRRQFDNTAERVEKDVDDQAKRIALLEELNIKMATIVEQLSKDVADHTAKIRELELKPARRYDYIVQNVIQWVIIAVLAMSKIFEK